MRLLIVDDEPMIRTMIRDILLKQGLFRNHEIAEAGNGEEAWAMFEATPAEIVVTDMRMPKLSGSDFIARVRQNPIDVEIIVITAFADLDMAVEVIREGVSELLRKPFKSQEMAFAVRKAVDRRRLKRENEEYRKRLVQAEKLSALGLLSAGLAHEINNPTTFIKGNLDILLKIAPIIRTGLEELIAKGRDADGKYALIAEKIESLARSGISGCERIQKIISGLLVFGRDSDKHKRPLTLQPFLNEALTLTSHRLAAHSIATHIPKDARKVLADPQETVQIFTNLLVNAADALDERWPAGSGGKLSITITDGDDTQAITFADNGTGMSEETRKHIFEPFFTTKPIGKGTGLGLSIVKGIVESSKGTLDCETSPGKGTTVTICLPHAKDPS